MTVIRATRTPDGERGQHIGPAPVRYATQSLWPGITWGWDARCLCTWAMDNGIYQVKYRDAICVNHRLTAKREWFADNITAVITGVRERARRAA